MEARRDPRREGRGPLAQRRGRDDAARAAAGAGVRARGERCTVGAGRGVGRAGEEAARCEPGRSEGGGAGPSAAGPW